MVRLPDGPRGYFAARKMRRARIRVAVDDLTLAHHDPNLPGSRPDVGDHRVVRRALRLRVVRGPRREPRRGGGGSRPQGADGGGAGDPGCRPLDERSTDPLQTLRLPPSSRLRSCGEGSRSRGLRIAGAGKTPKRFRRTTGLRYHQPTMIRAIHLSPDCESLCDGIPTPLAAGAAAPLLRMPTDQPVGRILHKVAGPDEELIRRVAAGDEEALRELFRAHGPYAKALALRVVASPTLAEEVVQEVFLSVWQHAGEYRAELGSVRAWLYAAVHNRAVDSVRREEAYRRRAQQEAVLSRRSRKPTWPTRSPRASIRSAAGNASGPRSRCFPRNSAPWSSRCTSRDARRRRSRRRPARRSGRSRAGRCWRCGGCARSWCGLDDVEGVEVEPVSDRPVHDRLEELFAAEATGRPGRRRPSRAARGSDLARCPAAPSAPACGRLLRGRGVDRAVARSGAAVAGAEERLLTATRTVDAGRRARAAAPAGRGAWTTRGRNAKSGAARRRWPCAIAGIAACLVGAGVIGYVLRRPTTSPEAIVAAYSAQGGRGRRRCRTAKKVIVYYRPGQPGARGRHRHWTIPRPGTSTSSGTCPRARRTWRRGDLHAEDGTVVAPATVETPFTTLAVSIETGYQTAPTGRWC